MGLRPWLIGILAGALLIALGIAAYQMGIAEGEKRARGQSAEAAETAPAAGPGRDLFVARCGSCHTLEAAGTDAEVGPNLDDTAPDAARVLAAIENGGTGTGQMPSDLVRGEQAAQVADYVAAAAGD
jgi:mono/diheme cytochrome c family protein